jgi:succinylarginine dihydrolase
MSDCMEVNFDGLVGPTHHYGGLSFGNRASMEHGSMVSNPRAAALQGLEKMWKLVERGYAQAVLPPLYRPNLSLLKRLGYHGSIEKQLKACAETSPELLSSVWSASSMWTANAATVIPSNDSSDGRLHLVPANLASQFHRSLEALATRDNLRAIFADTRYFNVPDPLPTHTILGDEGAANHTRFYKDTDAVGLHFFVHGNPDHAVPELRFPARQTRAASKAVARVGMLPDAQAVFAQQSVEAINAGVFHNDVIAVGHGDVLFCHEQAYENAGETLDALHTAFRETCGGDLRIVMVPASELSLEDAVHSYLFNSQLLDHSSKGKLLLVPIECMENPSVSSYLKCAVKDPGHPVSEVIVQDLRQSMCNGGGPACLRLRVLLTANERAAIRGRVFLDRNLYRDLTGWVNHHYREETAQAFSQLSEILQLPELYME